VRLKIRHQPNVIGLSRGVSTAVNEAGGRWLSERAPSTVRSQGSTTESAAPNNRRRHNM